MSKTTRRDKTSTIVSSSACEARTSVHCFRVASGAYASALSTACEAKYAVAVALAQEIENPLKTKTPNNNQKELLGASNLTNQTINSLEL